MGRLGFLSLAVSLLATAPTAFSCQMLCSESKGLSKGYSLILCDPTPGEVFQLSLDYKAEQRHRRMTVIDSIGCKISDLDPRIVDCKSATQSYRTKIVEEKTVQGTKSYVKVSIRANELKQLPREVHNGSKKLNLTFLAEHCYAGN